MKRLEVNSKVREEMIDITSAVEKLIPESGEGICVLFIQHTTCGLTINENADPNVQSDMIGFLKKLIPQHEPDLLSGRWQAIYLCEFDGPRERKIVVMIK